MRKFLVLAVLLPVLSGCSMFAAKRDAGFQQHEGAVPAEAAADAATLDETIAAADEAWADRANQESLERSIALYEKALAQASEHEQRRELLEKVARATYFLADGYLRNDADRQKRTYNLATTYGERCMGLDPTFQARIQGGARTENAVEVLDKSYVGCIYWAATGLGKWATLEGFATRVANKDRIEKFVRRVTDLDREYFYGGPDRYWGAFYAILPGFMGKDLDKSADHFEKSQALAPTYLGTKVLQAERLATERGDREMYKTLLTEVIEADLAINPEIMAENRIEQIKARELLEQIDQKIP